jgi:MYXO-CTERM domain-containing protein
VPRSPRILLVLLTLATLSGTSALAYVHQRTALQHPLRWADTLVHFVVQSEGAPGISDGSDRTAVRTAFSAWDSSENFLQLAEDSDPTQRDRTDWRSDDVHLVTWDSTNESGFFGSGSGLVAATPVEFDPATGAILDADVILDGTRPWSTTLEAGKFDVQAVVTHEVGHFLGLDHSAVHRATMNPAVKEGQTWQRSLESDDRAGATALYGVHTGAILSGLVQGADGKPISGAHVVAERRGVPVASGLSDYEGRYRIQGLPGGTYVVYAEPLNGAVTAAHLQLDSSRQIIDTDFGTTFWGPGGKSSPRTPAEVSLPAGSEQTLEPLVVEGSVPMRITGSPTPYLRPGHLRQGASISGRSLSYTDTILIPSSDVVLVGSRVGLSSVSLELEVSPNAATGLRSVRLIRDSDDACVVFTGGFEVRLPGPTVTEITPSTAQPGTRIQILGANLQPGARVFLGAGAARLDIMSTEEGSFLLPTVPSGRYTVVIENPDGQANRLSAGIEVTGGSEAPTPEVPQTSAPAAPGAGGGSGGGGCSVSPNESSSGAAWLLLLGLLTLWAARMGPVRRVA